MHESFVQRLQTRDDLSVVAESSSWRVSVATRSGWRFEITIPDNCNEWFVSGHDPQSETESWRDWCDWYESSNGPGPAELAEMYARDIEFFVKRVLVATEFRIDRSPLFSLFGRGFCYSANLQGRFDGAWRTIEPGTLPEDVPSDYFGRQRPSV